MAEPKKKGSIVQIEYGETYDPNSPYYIKPEDRSKHQSYSTSGGEIRRIDPFSWYTAWAHPETGQLVTLDEARNYWRPTVNPETGEETYEYLNPVLDEVVVPNWKEASRWVSMPTGGGGMRTFVERYKRKNNERFSSSPFDYNKEDDMGPIGPSAWDQAMEYARQHPVSDPADNFLNWLIFDALTLGGSSIGRQAVGRGLSALNNAGKATVEGLSHATPSGLMRGVSYYAPKTWAPTLNTIGKYGDAAATSYFLGNAANNIGWGLYNGDTQQIAQGGLDAMFGMPMFSSLRGTSGLVPAFNIASTPSSSSRLGTAVNNFLASPRTQAVAGGLGYSTLSAAASDRKPKLVQNEDGTWVQATDPNTGEPLWEDQNIFQRTLDWAKENPLDAAITGYLTYRVGKGGWNRFARKPAEPREFTVTKPNGEKVTKTRPEGSRVSAPEYEPVDQLPTEAMPEGLVYPTRPNIPERPTAEQFGVIPKPSIPRPAGFNESIIPDPGPRPTSGKKLQQRQRKWDQQNQQYQEQQARLREYNTQNAEAEQAWQAYDAPEQVDARTRYNQAEADYVAHEPEYIAAWDQYSTARDQYYSDYDAALASYNEQQRAAFPTTEPYQEWQTRDRLFAEYQRSPEYADYNKALESWRRRRAMPKNVWDWVKKNPVGVGLGAWWLGDKLFGGDSTPTPSVTPTTTPAVRSDTLGIIPGINVDSLRQTVRDSVINYSRYPNNAPQLVEDDEDEDND